jgi:hypothetical protein
MSISPSHPSLLKSFPAPGSGRAWRHVRHFLSGFLLLLALLHFVPQQAFGNGGVFATSSVSSTGNLQFQRKPKIDLEKELLHVDLDGDWAAVEVTYTLQNHGGADTLTYGFPIEANSGFGTYRFEESITGFEILDGERRLDVAKLIKEIHGSSDDFTEMPYGKIVRDWFMVTLKFDRNETKTLTVRYRVKSLGTSAGTSKSFLWRQSPRRFTYTFKPAKTWGSGRVRHLEITVDMTRLKAAHIPINSVAPDGARNENGQLRWNFENLDLAKAPDLVVEYDEEMRQAHAQVTAHRLDPKLIESIRTSSTHAPSIKAKYDPNNLLDGRLDTAWLTQGAGEGAWIDITFKRPIHLRGVGILNGYLKSAQSLAENGQVTEAEVRVFPGRVNDGRDRVKVQKTKFEDRMQIMPGAFVDWIFERGDSDVLAKHFRLTIKKAVSGQRYPETAISELYIYGSPKPRTSFED